jgi:hypothetical protein
MSNNDIPYLMNEFYKLPDGVAAIAGIDENTTFFDNAKKMRDSGIWDSG